MRFHDRHDAGRRLAARLQHLGGREVVVLGLPWGGVPVAFEVAWALGAPLDVIVVRKLGVPFQPELAMGAIGEGGVRILNQDVLRQAHITGEELAAVELREQAELESRSAWLRAGRERIPLRGSTALIVDDGIATGATARAACQVARANGADRVVLAAPVAASDVQERLSDVADEVICLQTPVDFYGVGQWYQDFSQVSDDEVIALLGHAALTEPRGTARTAQPVESSRDGEVRIDAGPVELAGHLTVPEEPVGVVAFAHGSGSSRHSPRNLQVAGALDQAGLSTLLFDLLTPAEEPHRGNVFDIPMLAERLQAATRWLHEQPETADSTVGYFGASTGAAAALWAAADPDSQIGAVVSRGGRPDLAMHRLAAVRAPTLLIVGGRDPQVLDLNRAALRRMTCQKRLTVVPGATHLFQEPGTLESVAELATDWFLTYLK